MSANGQLPLTFEQRRILSVSQLTRTLKGMIEKEWPGVWVRGEIGNLRVVSGHCYFNLKDEASCLKVVLFRNEAFRLKFKPADGQEVLARGRLTIFEPKGEYQLRADLLEPMGAGALQLAFEELKKKLAAEGLFEAGRKKPLPFLPRRVGVVTSPTGAALRDVLAVIRRRFPRVEVLIAPVKVQGDGAAPEIAEGIRRIDARGGCDVLIVGRGGGSLEDLWPFNEEPVARALAHCRTPTVSAVGHEIDFTIADFVADRRAATPSAAAEMVVPDQRELIARLSEGLFRLRRGQERRLERQRKSVDDLRGRLRDPRRVLEERRLSTIDLSERLSAALSRSVDLRRREVTAARRTLLAHGPSDLLGHERQRLTRVRAALQVAGERKLAGRRARLAELAGRLDAISPLAVLRRGYALVKDQESGELITRAARTREGQGMTVTLAEGEIRVKRT